MSKVLNQQLKRKVMFCIHLEFYKQVFLRNMQYVMPVAFFFMLLALVSFPDIMANLSATSLSSVYNFVFVALRDTEFAVQLIFAGLLLSLLVPIARRIFSVAIFKSLPSLRAS